MFLTKTRTAGTDVDVIAYIGDSKQHVIVQVRDVKAFVAVADLVDPMPADLPVSYEYAVMPPTAPNGTTPVQATPVAVEPVAAPVPVEPVAAATIATSAPATSVAVEESAVPAGTATPAAQTAVDLPPPIPPPIPVAKPSLPPGIPEKLPRGKGKNKVYAYIKGEEQPPSSPEQARDLNTVLKLAQTHGDKVVVSDGTPWVVASEFFKRLLA